MYQQYHDYVKRLCNSNIEHFMQYVSLDSGVPAHAEYIRHGLRFGRVHENINWFLDDIPYRNSLTFIITMNNLNVLGLQRLLEWILELRGLYSKTYQRVWFDTPILRQPNWQSLQILPAVYADRLANIIEWMKYNLETKDKPFTRIQRLRSTKNATGVSIG